MSAGEPPDSVRLVAVDVEDRAALAAWATTATRVFAAPRPTDRDLDARRDRFAGHRLTAAVDGGRTVATFRSYDTHLDVPGGRVPVNAVSSVAVLPTHRRRGLLTRWLSRDLRRAAEAGAPASILIASEAPIYARFGFGPASTACRWTVDTTRARFLPGRAGSVEIVEAAEHVGPAAEAYERARCRQPGAIDRSRLWWETTAQLRPGPGEPDPHRVLALHRDRSGAVDGSLVYRVRESWSDRVSRSRLEVLDLVAADDGAYADLWRYACEVDMVAEVVADDRSPVELLPWLLTDPRAARTGPVSDFLWVRLHDVPAALTARRYPVPGRVVLDVADTLDGHRGAVAGRWSLEVDEDGRATCDRTGQPADVALDAGALAAVWLGGVRPGVLARAGRLRADARELAAVEALLCWPDPAWCGTWF